MGRMIEYSTRKTVNVPLADHGGFGQWKAQGGDFITYRENYTDGSYGRRFARVIGVITKCDNQGPSGVGKLLVLAVSDDGSFGYERWVEPEEVLECKHVEHAKTFLTWLVNATTSDMHLYIRDDLKTREAASYIPASEVPRG